MKKRIIALCLLLLLLAACKGEEQGTTVAPDDYVTTAAAARAVADYLGWDISPLEEEDRDFYLSGLYGLEEGLWLEATVYAPGGVDSREVAVLRLSDPENGETAAAALESYRKSRYGDFYGYSPDQAALVEKGRVVTEDGCAALLLCEDPAGAERALLASLRGEEPPAPMPTATPAETPEPTPTATPAAVPEPAPIPTPEPAPEPTLDISTFPPFDPPNEFDMTLYDTSAIRAAYASGDDSGLSEKDAVILEKCREVLTGQIKPGMTDFEKELALHDWLVDQGRYDQSVHNKETPMGQPDNTNPYGVLVHGYGICLGYATTFQLLMDLAGVECITVIGASADSTQDHAWNMVKLEGEWYCVDPTWDDPTEYIRSAQWVHHYYFNMTSEQMRETNHQWDYANVPEATATRFRWDGTGEKPQ